MKFRFTFLLPVILLFFSALAPKASTKAQEIDYVAAAVAGLQSSSVYVYPNTPGTDDTTPDQLGIYLQPNDNVVLIMLPVEALTNTDMSSIVKQISYGLNNEKIIGLAIGNKLIGYSAQLPSDVVADLMANARSVSNNPVTALFTFSRNVNLWRLQNPQPAFTPTPAPTSTPRPTMQPIDLPKAEEVGWPIWLCLSITIIIFFVFLSRSISNGLKKSQAAAKRQERYDGLEQLRQKIQSIEIDIDQIIDRKIKKDLQNAILLAYGLIDMLQEHQAYIGITEDLTPEMISNMDKQVKALLRHESGRRPMNEGLLSDLTEALLNYDALFKALQADDPNEAELLASVINTRTTIISRRGYFD